MKKNNLCKCLITLGLLLFITMLLPLTSYNTVTAQAAIVEKEVKDSYRLNLKSVTLVKGKTFTLKVIKLGSSSLSTNSKVSFKSDDAEVASVSDDGTITANKVGATTVTVTIKDGIDKTPLLCDVTVGPAAISVKWTQERVFVGLGNEDILKVIIKPDNTTEAAKFSSYDTSIAAITSGGRITTKKIGLTYLFAEIDAANLDGSRKFAICTVFITSPKDAPLLEEYFSKRSELNRIPDLNKALDEFFNGGSAEAAVSAADATESALIIALDNYLVENYKLSEIRAKIKAELDALTKSTNTDANSVSQAK